MTYKTFTLTLLALAAALPLAAQAEGGLSTSFNVGAVSDYRYRGISQTRLKPALQGGVDLSHPSGFYLGAWASTVRWVKDLEGDAGVEVDVYGGYKGELAKGLGYDVGVLGYVYPSNKLATSANTTELYGALSFGPATLKYSHAVTDTFGNTDSKNSFYLDASASFDLGGGWMLAPHLGYQKIKGPFGDAATYTDGSLTLSKDFSGLVPSIALVATDADKAFYVPGPAGNSTKFLGRSAVVLGVKYSF
ncbi:MAG: hypothetical protein HUU30_15800 [Burkholderiaceae bacterium]|nr:TorF family putative porin [Aquabacterium sp.]NUP87199.1 hypothetical protein [Burkholderiaceae bacterium]